MQPTDGNGKRRGLLVLLCGGYCIQVHMNALRICGGETQCDRLKDRCSTTIMSACGKCNASYTTTSNNVEKDRG